jgi:hypothetical protein
VPLHVLEGLLDALETVDQEETEAVEEVEEEAIVAMAHAGTSEKIKRKSMNICGKIRKLNVDFSLLEKYMKKKGGRKFVDLWLKKKNKKTRVLLNFKYSVSPIRYGD